MSFLEVLLTHVEGGASITVIHEFVLLLLNNVVDVFILILVLGIIEVLDFKFAITTGLFGLVSLLFLLLIFVLLVRFALLRLHDGLGWCNSTEVLKSILAFVSLQATVMVFN